MHGVLGAGFTTLAAKHVKVEIEKLTGKPGASRDGLPAALRKYQLPAAASQLLTVLADGCWL